MASMALEFDKPRVRLPTFLKPKPDLGIEVVETIPQAQEWIKHRDYRNPRKSVIYFIGDLAQFRFSVRTRLNHLQTLADHATASRPRPKAEMFEMDRIQAALELCDLMYQWGKGNVVSIFKRPYDASFLHIATRLRKD